MAVWSEIPLSNSIAAGRADAEYFQPEYLRLERVLRQAGCARLDALAIVTDGIHASPDVVENDGVMYLSAKCVKDNDFALADALQISKEQDAANKRTRLRVDDVLITTVGTIGNAAVVTDDLLPANADRHLGIVRIKPDAGIDPCYLSTFLNSRLGRFQTLREATGNVQLNLFIEKMNTLRVPSIRAQKHVADLTRRAYATRKQAQERFADAESLLVSALGLNKLDLMPRLFYEDRYEAVAAAGRFDAEYYQPAKLRVLDALAKMKGRVVGEQYRSVKSLWQPDRVPPAERVRNYDLTAALSPFLDETLEPTPAAEIGSTKKRLQAGDLVVSRLRSYLKEIAVVLPSEGAPTVGSTEFIVLRAGKDAVRAEALLVFLRSPCVQTVLKWCQDGSNHPRFDEKEVLGLRVPSAVADIQDDLAELVEKSIAARREARRLLDEAKALVERAILAPSGRKP